MRQAVFFVFATLGYFAYSQNTTPIYIIEGDTLSTPYVGLGEVVVLPQLKFGTYEDYLAYYRLRQRTLKVYPYAMLASKRLTILNERLAHIKGRRAQKRYTKQVERYVEGEFKDELKKLT